jgi:adhesin/invasin
VRVHKISSRRLAVMATAVATVAAGLPALLGAGASAAPTGDINVTGPTHGAAGSCLTYTVTPTDAFGRPANDTGTIVVRLTENPNGSSQDVDFCTVTGASTPSTAPHYVNASSATRTYTAGASVTSASPADVASTTTPAAQANPNGRDTAVFIYNGSAGASTTTTFGVVGLAPGGATVEIFRSADGDENPNTGDLSRTISLTFTAGGLPDSPEAADAVSTVVVLPEASFSPTGGPAHSFTADLTNSSGDGVSGVTPSIRATAGPNAGTATTAATFTASCTRSNNVGRSTCTYQGTKSGTDTVTVWVDQTRARTTPANPTAGIDNNEPRDTATATNTVAAAQAKSIDLTPDTAAVTSGTSKVLTATVTDTNGTPAAGVGITFTETGPGNIQGGTAGTGTTSSLNATTDASGKATVTITTTTTGTGTDTVTAAIRTPANTLCQTSGGRCSDTSTLTISVASPSPSPSSTSSPSPTCTTASTLLSTAFIYAMETANVTVTAARGSTVDLYAYTRPTTTYAVVRSGVVAANGTISWGIRPPRNTRLYAQQRGCPAGNQVVLGVRTTLSLSAVRNGTRNYTFSGDSLPARPGGLIVSLYRIDPSGVQTLTSQVRASATTGEWILTRQFTGTGKFGFVVRTGADLQNAPGSSRVRPTLIY